MCGYYMWVLHKYCCQSGSARWNGCKIKPGNKNEIDELNITYMKALKISFRKGQTGQVTLSAIIHIFNEV